MIIVTRFKGERFALNTDLLLRIDSSPDTILTMIDGTKFLVIEPIDEIIAKISEDRAHVLARAQEISAAAHGDGPVDDSDEHIATATPLHGRR